MLTPIRHPGDAPLRRVIPARGICDSNLSFFSGRDVGLFECNKPTHLSDNFTKFLEEINIPESDYNASHVTFSRCHITIAKDNSSTVIEQHGCLYGYNYSYDSKLSFRTEVMLPYFIFSTRLELKFVT